MQLDHAIEHFLRALKERAFSLRTVEGYRADLSAWLFFIALRLGNPAPLVSEVNTDLVRDFVSAVGPKGKPLAPASRNRRLSAIRSFFTHLRDTGLWPEGQATPDQRVRFARLPRKEPAFLHYDEYLAMLQAVRKTPSSLRRTRNFAILVTLLNTGLRLRELTLLDVWQFNVTARVFSAVRRKGNVLGDVILNRNVIHAVGEWLRLRPEGPGPLFTGQWGRRISARAVQRMVSGYAKEAGITKPVGVHTLRHAFCYEAQKRGAGIEVARRLMAHRSIMTTLLYTHARDDEVRIAIDAFDDPRTWSADADMGAREKTKDDPK